MFTASKEIEKKYFQKGSLVFEEGQKGDCAYIIETGGVEIFKSVEGQHIHLAVMGEGALFGEMAVIDGSPRMANARTTANSVIVFLPRKLFESKLQKFDPVMRSMVQILLGNLRSVHKAYMHRPRSVDDYLNAMAFHSDAFQTYLRKLPEDAATREGRAELEAIDTSIRNLRSRFKDHEDVRASALSETDISRTLSGRDGKGTGR